MADKIVDQPWHTDLETFMGSLFEAKKNLPKGYWCTDFDVKYLTLRIDTRDLGYLLFADGRKNYEEKFRIDPSSVNTAIEKWGDKYGN